MTHYRGMKFDPSTPNMSLPIMPISSVEKFLKGTFAFLYILL